MQPTLLVLAAGIGSRYGGLKQTDPMGPGGATIIDYSIFDAIRAGFGRVTFIIRREMEDAFRETIASRFESRIEVDYVYQEMDACTGSFSIPPGRAKPWGTGHAVLVARDAIADPFAVINADDFYGRTAFDLLCRHLDTARDTAVANYAMAGFILRNTLSEFGSVARGVCKCDEDNVLKKVTEITDIVKDGSRAKYRDETGKLHPLSGDETVSMNTWGFTPSVFDHLSRAFDEFLQERGYDTGAEFFLPTVINGLIATGTARVKVLPSADAWFGVTYPEDKRRVVRNIKQLIARGEYPESLWR
jgi:NDP-sugar pyrophosphorylase family protein